MTMKVLFERGTDRILGAQIVGYDGVDKRIDVIATAIRAGMKASELKRLDLAYAPPYSSAKDPVNMAGFVAENIRDGLVRFAAFDEPDKMAALGEGLREMMRQESPYLIQCTLGKDRTGIIIALLEALCGASPEEVTYDYMLSFENLHDVELNPQSRTYQVYRDQLLTRLGQMGFPTKNFSDENLEPYARNYLKKCGLSEEEIDALRAILEGKEVVLPEPPEKEEEPAPES